MKKLTYILTIAALLILSACETDIITAAPDALTLSIPEVGAETRVAWTSTGTTGQWQTGDALYITATYTDAGPNTVATQHVAATRTSAGTWAFSSTLTAPAAATGVTILARHAHLYNPANTTQNALLLASTTNTTQLSGTVALNAFQLTSARFRFTGLPAGSALSFDAYNATTHPWHIPAIGYTTNGTATTNIPSVSADTAGSATIYVDATAPNVPLRFRIGGQPAGNWYTFNPGAHPEGATNYHGQQYNIDCTKLMGNSQDSDDYMDKIASANELMNFLNWAGRCRAVQATANIYEDFTLKADIDLTGIDWVPIGAQDNNYHGTFDGGGHTIKGLTVNVSGSAGLFGVLGHGGVVKNLTVEGANVNSNGRTGAIVGENEGGYVIACRAVNCTVATGFDVGGIVGCNYGVIVACHTNGGSIQGEFSGGITGNNAGQIIACVAEPVTVTGQDAGALVGGNSNTLTACYWRPGTGVTEAIGKDHTSNTQQITQLTTPGLDANVCDALNAAIEAYNNDGGHIPICDLRWSSSGGSGGGIPGSGGDIGIGGFDDEDEIPVGGA